MNEIEFSDSFDKLGKNFNIRGKALDEKKEVFWEIFSKVSASTWKEVCERLLRNEERFPTVAKFSHALKDIMQSSVYKNNEAPVNPCGSCDGSGYVSTVKISEEGKVMGEYSFRCSCANGSYHSKELLIWDNSLRVKGHVPKVEYDGLGGWELESGDYVAPHEEQQARMKMVTEIQRLMDSGKKEEAQNKILELDKRIDSFKSKI